MWSIITKRWCIVSFFIIGLLIRLLLIPNPGFEADISFWKSWGLAPFDFGAIKGMDVTNFNYPTPFIYFLWGILWVYSLFADPHNFNQFWNNSNLLFLTLAKLPSIIADLGIAGLIILLGKKSASQGQALRIHFFPEMPFSLYVALSALFLFNPIALIDGALWGQVDSLGVCIFLCAVVLSVHKKYFLSGVVFMLAMMTKLQNMIYGPLFFLFVFQIGNLPGLIKTIGGSVIAFFGFNLEFVLTRRMSRVIESITGNYDYFPLLSLNAYNFWWIIAAGNGMKISDKINFLGLLSAKTTGLLLFSSGYLLAVLAMAKNTIIKISAMRNNIIEDRFTNFLSFQYETHNQLVPNKTSGIMKTSRAANRDNFVSHASAHESTMYFFIALIIANVSFFLFQTESHDRYLFPLSVFSLFLIPFVISYVTTVKNRIRWWTTRPFKIFTIGYMLYTLFYFINLHSALVENYPNNGIAALLFLNSNTFSIPLSCALIGLFVFFLFSIRKLIGTIPIVISVLCFLSLVLFLNLPLLFKKPIILTRLTPISKTQDWGMMGKNMPVGAVGGGWKQWNRLSVQYSFYTYGIGTHAKSVITYDIGKKFQRFTSDVGVDTEAGPKGSVIFEIYGDNQLLYRSPLVKRYEYPRHADVSVAGVTILTLVVTDGGDGNIDDHADWLNPLLFP